jgi:hypothetical protein
MGKTACAVAAMAALMATFAWYFHGLVAIDLVKWWATCF